MNDRDEKTIIKLRDKLLREYRKEKKASAIITSKMILSFYEKNKPDAKNMFYVEDPFDESDFEGFAQLTSKVGDKCLICGDDLFVTNKELLSKGIEMNAANAIIIKPNQIGSLSETYATVKLAKENNIVPVVSHRSGETTDETIAHLAVGFAAPLIKTGAIGGERIAKLNELIRIEEELTNPKMGHF